MTSVRSAPGAQTLARGLRALEFVAAAQDGVLIQHVADELGVHRSIASRVLATLADFKMIVRGHDGRYRIGTGIAALAAGIHTTLRVAAEPYMRDLAEELGATMMLLIAEGDEAVALSVVQPSRASYHLTFGLGGRHRLGMGSGGVALYAAAAPTLGEPERVTEARAQGYAATFGEVEPGAYGVAVPMSRVAGMPMACLSLITHRKEIATEAPPVLMEAVKRLSAELS